MRRLAIVLALLSVLFGLFAVVRERLGQGDVIWGSLRISTGQLLLLAVILAMIALLTKFYFAGEPLKLVARDARMFFWVAGLVILGTLVSLGLGAGRQLSQDEIVEQFYKVYYSPERLKTTFLGIASLQYPTDNWAMQ